MYKYMYNEELYEDFNLFEQYTPIDLIYFITSHNHLVNDTLFLFLWFVPHHCNLYAIFSFIH